ncbi:hypothetical protein AVEN_164487-1 [Araneus ventricosus]|uniref:Integrase catalytic domain-containing protein n=1 Tax=Araneus ventricosus TaxID=182803 RepID=A0A4Y2IPU1_ARAVE|nr:hypothetical protein AVEN_164487-1 [Araneus ventricosus]
MVRVRIDSAGPFQSQMFFLPVDSFSKLLEKQRLSSSSATSKATIKAMREIFATHGISCHQLRNPIMVASIPQKNVRTSFQKIEYGIFLWRRIPDN